MKMDLERIGSRHRDSTNHFAAESEALDQIAKEVSVTKNYNSIKKKWLEEKILRMSISICKTETLIDV